MKSHRAWLNIGVNRRLRRLGLRRKRSVQLTQQHEMQQGEVARIVNTSSIIPFDDNLLERARSQWQTGDWQSLAKLEPRVLLDHPERAKLLLLAAAGQLQLGRQIEAGKMVRLAMDWGVTHRLVGEVLVAGVFNSLGRAAAVCGLNGRALSHFEDAITLGAPGSDSRLLASKRARRQMQQLGLPEFNLEDPRFYINSTEPIVKTSQNLSAVDVPERLNRKQNSDSGEDLTAQRDALDGLKRGIETKFKQELLNAIQQIEAFLEIQSFFNNGAPLPAMHGWAISPDFGIFLVRLIARNNYNLIIEFGSGASTVLIAKTLEKTATNQYGSASVVHVAFEHLEPFHARTLAELESHGLADSVQLSLAPLQPYVSPNGQVFNYYSCHDKLAEIARHFEIAAPRILVVVDGPPGNTGKHARYPCLPAVLAQFNNFDCIDILLDDYARRDEFEIGELWKEELSGIGYQVKSQKFKMEKDALLVSVAN